jgi:hypothetical protein
MQHTFLKIVLAAALALAVTPVIAQAAPDPSCVPTFFDSSGGYWDLTSAGAISDGGLDTSQPLDGSTDRTDSYDLWPYFSLTADGTTYDAFDADTAPCTTALDGREVLYPAVTIDGLSVSRRVYIPSSGSPFARFLNVVSNPGATPITVGLNLGGLAPFDDNDGDLGSDGDTTVFSSSSGDGKVTPDDIWATTWDTSVSSGVASGDPALGHLWEGTGLGDRLDAISSDQNLNLLFNQVTVQPGQTLIYMQVETQQATPEDAGTVIAALASEPAELYAGISDADRLAVQNFCAGDCDRDGHTDGTAGTPVADNCPTVSNADQADLDGDGQGDACDDDIDGDGRSNAVEAAIGTDPRKVDTDGDGVKDAADACPTVAGAGANGCPRFDDATPPTVKVTGVKSKLKRKLLAKGIKGKVACNESCSVTIVLYGARKGAMIAKAGDVELGSKKLALGTGTRSFTVKPAKSLVKAVRKGAKLRVLITASDASHNSRQTTKKVKIT